MNWSFILTALAYGLLGGLWTAGVAIGAMDAAPSQWGWIRLVAGALVSFVGGIFLYTRNPSGAWNQPPGAKL